MSENVARLLTLTQFCQRYGIGRTKTFEEIKERRLCAVKVGTRTMIPFDAAEKWLASLPTSVAA